MIDGLAGKPFSATTLPPLPEMEKSHKEKIIKVSREKYSNPRHIVEEKIAKWSEEGSTQNAETFAPQTPQVTMYDARCSICGKDTKVVFKPDGVRPVYCKPCRKKLEEEKAQPSPTPTPNPTPAPIPVPAPANETEKEPAFASSSASSEAMADKSAEASSSAKATEDKTAGEAEKKPEDKPEDKPVENIEKKIENKPEDNTVSLKQAVEKQPSFASLNEAMAGKPVFFSMPKKNRIEREKPKRKEVDVNGLKQELEDALKDEDDSPASAKATAGKKEGVIEPGETIKL